jgi:[ribosomal protein S18]-alanine N-acetyltransferase
MVRKVPGIVLREYRSMDIEAMYRLDEVCFAEAFRFDRQTMRRFAEAVNAAVVVAESEDGGLAGFVIAHVEQAAVGWHGYVVTLDVAEGWRRMGLAQRMMAEAEQRVAAAGAQWMDLHVFNENEGAIRFYERVGYERVGLRRGFYRRAGMDAYVYRRKLNGL